MSNNPPCLLLDTNIWLEMYIPSRAQQAVCLELVNVAQQKDAALAYASHAALDVYQKVRKENKRWAREHGTLTESMAKAIKRLAWDCVNDMQRLAMAIPADSGDFYLACKHRDIHDDLEDDLVLAACKKAHANYLVTLDRDLLARSPVEAVTPGKMLELLRSGMAKGTPFSEEGTDWLYEWLRTV